ncbi:MAG: 2OG-Fe(II) oxygenase family protein, partial [Solimonas sp.]
MLRMFPTFVWKAELRPEVCAPINGLIERKLAEIGAPLAGLESGECWQSDHGLHELMEFRGLVDHLGKAAECVLDCLKIGPARLEITGCWANVSAPGAKHGTHSHPNNYLSGVYYVRIREGADTINFHDPRPQIGIMRPPVGALTAENTDQVVVKVKDGTVLLFPAWLQHSVDANRSGHLRISVAFNLMFSSYAETMGKP